MSNDALRAAIDDGDVAAVRALVNSRPAAATEDVSWDDGRGAQLSSAPIGYVALARFHGRYHHDRAGELALALLDGGAPVEGAPDARETPLVTAASYNEPEVAQALIARGADLTGKGYAAPGGSALAHATFFGNGDMAALLVAAGAPVRSLAEAVGAGRLEHSQLASATPDEHVNALRTAAVCDRPEAIDWLLDAGVDVNASNYIDGADGGTALHWAAWHGKVKACRRLVQRGADPEQRDQSFNGTPLDWCRVRRARLFTPSPGHDAVETYLYATASGVE